jgi:hypothetical protein
MTRYYRDLHDRELLNQAESMLGELHRRQLLDIRVPASAPTTSDGQVRYPVDSIVRNGNALSIVVDGTYEPVEPRADRNTNASSKKERR